MDGRPHRRSLGGWGLFALVGVLLCFGALNIAVRATWHKLEDGVLWQSRPEGVMAVDVALRSTAMTAGIRRGDLLIAINGSPIETPDDVQRALTQRGKTERLSYTVLRLGQHQMLTVQLAPAPGGNPTLYFILASIGIFTLLVGGSVRLRRANDPATLHFFWLCLAFFGTLTFSFSRLDRLDWYFYWADAIATLPSAEAPARNSRRESPGIVVPFMVPLLGHRCIAKGQVLTTRRLPYTPHSATSKKL